MLALLISAALAVDVTGSIEDNMRLGLRVDSVNTKLTLSGANGQTTTYITAGNKFRFADVPDGSYVLEVSDLKNYYEPVLVEVKGKVRANLYSVKTGKGPKLSSPFVLDPSQPMTYFEKKEPFDPTSILKSPMGIMILVSVGMYFLM